MTLIYYPCNRIEIKMLNHYGWCAQREKAAAKRRLAFYTIKAVRNGFKWEIQAQAKLLRRRKKVKVEITHATTVVVLRKQLRKRVACFVCTL